MASCTPLLSDSDSPSHTPFAPFVVGLLLRGTIQPTTASAIEPTRVGPATIGATSSKPPHTIPSNNFCTMRLSPLHERHKLSRHAWGDYTICKDGLTSQPGTADYPSAAPRHLIFPEECDRRAPQSSSETISPQRRHHCRMRHGALADLIFHREEVMPQIGRTLMADESHLESLSRAEDVIIPPAALRQAAYLQNLEETQRNPLSTTKPSGQGG